MPDEHSRPARSAEDDSSRLTLEHSSEGAAPAGRVRRVLLIEDDPIDALIVRRSLRDADDARYVIEHVTSLADAVQRLSAAHFHIVLLDLQLPDSAGLPTFLTLRERFPHVPVVVLSGLDDKQVALQATEAGAQDYVVKGDFSPEVLRRSIRHARARHKVLRELTRFAEEIRQREALLASVLDSIDEAVVVVEPAGRFALMNPAARRILGGPTDVPPDQWSRHFGFFLPDGKTPFPAERLPLLRAMHGDSASGIELWLRNEHVAEGMALVASTRPLLDGSGAFRGGMVVFRDVTSEKQAIQERIRRFRMERDLELAAEVQQRLFPQRMPQLAGMDIAARGCVIADISGHDLGSALVMAQTQAYVRATVACQDDPAEVLSEVNRHLVSPVDPVRFVTMFLALVDPHTRQVRYASAGHPGFLVRADGTVQMLDATGTVLGLFDNADFTTHPPITLNSGDVLFVPTDGVYEAHAPGGELFSMERLISVLRDCRHLSAAEMIDCVFEAALKFGGEGPPHDDLSAIAIKAR